jgi:hypothetical protein
MPDLLERAPSGRSRCRACSGTIAKDELRFGEEVDNPFTDGRTTLWFHVDCAALRRPEKARPLLAEDREDVPNRARLLEEADLGIQHPRLCRIAKVERARSGRAHCRHCKDTVDKDELRFGLEIFDQSRWNPMGFIHLRCAEPYFGARPSEFRLARLVETLESDVRSELESQLGSLP